eukprot:snap_masked-scaffold_50-processed-gene-0.32-mRNA-1 protein AED:1.00 eAED:1.00 QI:0/-1/0/0/-1/1/1/0/409
MSDESDTPYDIFMGEKAWDGMKEYYDYLCNPSKRPGKYLLQRCRQRHKMVHEMDEFTFINCLLATKRLLFYTHENTQGGGEDWQDREFEILGEINLGMKVLAFDNGVPEPDDGWKVDHTFKIHEKPIEAYLLFTPCILLKHPRYYYGDTPDYTNNVQIEENKEAEDQEENYKEDWLIQDKYSISFEKRVLPVLHYANYKAETEGKKAVITMPILGRDRFAGAFKEQIPEFVSVAMKTLLDNHHESLGNVKCIIYDSEIYLENDTFTAGGIQFRTRPLEGNESKRPLASFEDLAEDEDDFSDCVLFKIVNWDQVSFPGNEFLADDRATDNGTAAAATNCLEKIFGLTTEYDPEKRCYKQPENFPDWKHYAEDLQEDLEKEEVLIQIQDKLWVFNEKGELEKKEEREVEVD